MTTKESEHTEYESSSRIREQRLQKLEKIKSLGIEPYPYKFTRSHKACELQVKYKNLANGQETSDVSIVAGRIHNERNDWMFIDLYDDSGKIQLYWDKEKVKTQVLASLLDKGDFIGIRHMMFLSHSYDHRIVDGALGGSFVKRVADYLEKFDVSTLI